MKSVWIITSGCYSNYGIEHICSSKEVADQISETHNKTVKDMEWDGWRVSEWQLTDKLPDDSELLPVVNLKMDIEGAEYELLDLVVQSQQEICGLAIEFHQPLHNIEAIGYFAKQLNLNITNVHVNNCLPKRDLHNTEPCIEISFSCHKGIEKPEGLPHPLERDNDPTCSPIAIRWN